LSDAWSFTFLGGGHWQEWEDVDDDAWADLPAYDRGVFRPRVFWDGGNGRSFFATAGVTVENRDGGTQPDGALPNGEPYVEALDTRRFDVGLSGQTLLGERIVLTARAAFARQGHDHQFGEVLERDTHRTGFGEVALRGTAGAHTWVVGAAVEHDAYRPKDVPQFEHTFTIPGVFVQDDIDLASWFALSASARLDHHNEYGTFLSPRVSALFRSGAWTSRVSAGLGFFGPSALTEETEAAGLTRLTIPNELEAEKGRSASLDLTRTDGPLSYTVTLFASKVVDPIHVDRATGLVLTTAEGPTTNTGVELLGTFRSAPYALTATYTFVHSRERDGSLQVESPLTPTHSAGLIGMWEREDAGRVGVEVYYTGRQRLEENPYRHESEPYVIVGVLGERQFGKVRLFINGENLTGVRQTEWDPLIRPTRAADGRWTVDAWAPLDGVNVNGGVRIRF